MRVFSVVDVAFDVRAFLSLFILVFLFFTIQASFNPTLSLLSLAYDSARLERRAQLLEPVVGIYSVVEPSPVLGRAAGAEEEFVEKAYPVCKGNSIEILEIGVSAPIVEGESGQALEKGVWRLPRSAKPGTAGNAVLAGHRWALVKQSYGNVFRHLPELSVGDQFTICYDGNLRRYRVFKTKVVEAEDLEDLFDIGSEGSFVTLYTCHPLWRMDKRFVVFAEEI